MNRQLLLTFFIFFLLSFCECLKFVERVCPLPPDKGSKCPNGSPPQESLYYFNMTLEKCVSFDYFGCGGNQNKFGGFEDCTDSCQTPYFLKKNAEEEAKYPGGVEPHNKSDCGLKPVPGNCKALIVMWYWNGDAEPPGCEMFGYGGCNGNGNKFDTRRECESFCHDSIEDNIE